MSRRSVRISLALLATVAAIALARSVVVVDQGESAYVTAFGRPVRLIVLRTEMDAAQAKFEARAAAVAKSSADPEAQKRRGQEINDFSRAFQGTLKDMGHDAVLAQYFIMDDHVGQ